MTHQINVTNWFASGRGTISSMGTLVSGLINAIMATVTGVLSSMFGYQTYSLIAGFVLAGIIVVLVCCSCAMLPRNMACSKLC